MDTLIVSGDHYTDSRGIPVAVEGAAEMIQRVLIRLGVKRGSLLTDPGFGSELYRLGLGSGEMLGRLARGYVQEALAPMAEITVGEVAVSRGEEETLSVAVEIGYGDEQYQLEVQVNQ